MERNEKIDFREIYDVRKVSGLGEYQEKLEKERMLYLREEKVFLVVNKKTIEVRTDLELSRLLQEKYESVMRSRYFGKGGVEIVLAGKQLGEDELDDLVRLSYNLS